MRRTLLASLLAFGLPLLAHADETRGSAAPVVAAAARPAQLVGVILSSAQALLWDDERGEYVLHRVGDDAFGGRLVELDADHVVIERGEAREVMELSAPPQMRVAGKRQPKRLPAMVISAAPEREAVAAATPAPVVAPAPAVVAPALVAPPTSTEIALAAAPRTAAPALRARAGGRARDSPLRLRWPRRGRARSVARRRSRRAAPVVAPPLPSPPATAPVATPVTPSAPATATVARAVTADRRPVAAMLIPRADLDRELGDFASLSQDVQVAQQPEGGFRLAAVRPGSFFERIGLRAQRRRPARRRPPHQRRRGCLGRLRLAARDQQVQRRGLARRPPAHAPLRHLAADDRVVAVAATSSSSRRRRRRSRRAARTTDPSTASSCTSAPCTCRRAPPSTRPTPSWRSRAACRRWRSRSSRSARPRNPPRPCTRPPPSCRRPSSPACRAPSRRRRDRRAGGRRRRRHVDRLGRGCPGEVIGLELDDDGRLFAAAEQECRKHDSDGDSGHGRAS